LVGAAFSAGYIAGQTQAASNLPPIWEVSKWIALGRELERTIPLLEHDQTELIQAIEQEQEGKPWTKAKTMKTN
jgi:hypothetical protein